MFDDDELEPIEDEEQAEVIDPREVDQVILAINDLIETVQSPTIKEYLETTCEDIAYLIEEDEVEEEDEDEDLDYEDLEDEDLEDLADAA